MSPGWQLVLAIGPAALSAVFVYMQAGRQSRERAAAQLAIDRRHQSDEVSERYRLMYDQIVADLRTQVDRAVAEQNRLQEQYSRLSNEFRAEREGSFRLRQEWEACQIRMRQLESTIGELSRLVQQLGGEIPTPLGPLPLVSFRNQGKDSP